MKKTTASRCLAAIFALMLIISAAGCATPEPKPGGLELTEQQLEEISAKLYPEPLPRFDSSIWETVFKWETEMKIVKNNPSFQVLYVTILQQVPGKYNVSENFSFGITYYQARIEKVVSGTMEQGKTITFYHEGGYDEETGILTNTPPDFVPLSKEEKMLVFLVYSDYYVGDTVTEGLMFQLSGTAVEIDGKEYLVYRSMRDTPVRDLLPQLSDGDVRFEKVYSKYYEQDMEIAIVEPSAMEREIKAFLEKE